MASEARDPREALLREWSRGLSDGSLNKEAEDRLSVEFLARLDAADPLRKLLPQIMALLNEARPPARLSESERRTWVANRNRTLHRIRTITPEGGEQP